jgi:hypothetical protein
MGKIEIGAPTENPVIVYCVSHKAAHNVANSILGLDEIKQDNIFLELEKAKTNLQLKDSMLKGYDELTIALNAYYQWLKEQCDTYSVYINIVDAKAKFLEMFPSFTNESTKKAAQP